MELSRWLHEFLLNHPLILEEMLSQDESGVVASGREERQLVDQQAAKLLSSEASFRLA